MLPAPVGTGIRRLQMKGCTACLAATLCFQNGKTMGEVTEAARGAIKTPATQSSQNNLSEAEVA